MGSRIGTPQIALPLANDDGGKRYAIGSLTIAGARREIEVGRQTSVVTPPVAPPPAANPWDEMFEQPLVRWALAIGEAKSLPWGSTGTWDAVAAAYQPESAAEDSLALLTADAPVLARMETMRRAVVYSRQDPGAAYRLLAALAARVSEAEEANKADALRWFDLGYFFEVCRQARWLDKELLGDRNGYSLVMKAVRLAGAADPGALEMQFAAGLILLEPKGQHPYYPHFKTVVKEVKEGSLLERNLLTHLKDKFEADTLAGMRASKYLR